MQRDDEVLNPEMTVEQFQHLMWRAHVSAYLKSMFDAANALCPLVSKDRIIELMQVSRTPDA